jgi:hypothetical protein
MKNKLPSADECPVTFEIALRLAVGGRSVPDRFHTWRMWWKSELARVARATGVHTDNTDKMVAYFRHNGVDASWLGSFCAGIAAYKAEQGIEQRRQAAVTRWGRVKKAPRKGRK